MAHILIVEDDIHIAKGIAEYLEVRGYQLDFAYHGKQALALLAEHHYDLVLLDLNLPQLGGLEVCRALQHKLLARIPVIMVTAKGEADDVVAGFEAGAWDYLVKPFSFSELLARIKVSLAKVSESESVILQYSGVQLEKSSLTMSFNQHMLQLHPVGFELVWMLMKCAPKAVSSAELQRQIWGEWVPESDPLRTHVYKLRKQFKACFGQEFITTIKGVGYGFALAE